MARNTKRGSTGQSWGPFLQDPMTRLGYSHSWAGTPPIETTSLNYEWGRLIAAEVKSREPNGPSAIPEMRRTTKAWMDRIQACCEFRRLVAFHYQRNR